jgi:DNA polymerase (family 10)
MLLRRPPYAIGIEAVVDAAARHHVALEINSQAYRLDLNDVQARLARDRGVSLVISSDAHSPQALAVTRWGLWQARRAWLSAADVLNTQPFATFRASLRRNRP